MSIEEKLTPLIANPTSWDLFTQEEPQKRLPLAEQKCNNCYRGDRCYKGCSNNHIDEEMLEKSFMKAVGLLQEHESDVVDKWNRLKKETIFYTGTMPRRCISYWS